jgi:protein translocase SecG subunit
MLMLLEIIVSLLLSFLILLQHRTSGLSSTFGGSGAVYVQRRGAEMFIYKASIWLSIVFFAIPVVLWYVQF